MKVKKRIDNNGSLVFEINSKQITINIPRLKCLMKANIRTVFGRMGSFSSRLSDDGEAVKEENKKRGWIRLNLDKIVNPKDENSVVQKKIIDVLSHEARHICQRGTKNKLFKLNNKLYNLFSFSLIIMTVLAGIVQVILLIKGDSISFYLNVFLFLPIVFLILLTMFYFLDPGERDARKFAQKAVNDKRWLGIVKVEKLKTK